MADEKDKPPLATNESSYLRSASSSDDSDPDDINQKHNDEESFLKLLLYYRQFCKILVRRLPYSSRKKDYVLSGNLLELCFTNLVEKIERFPSLKQFSPLFSKKNCQQEQSWTEFRDMLRFISLSGKGDAGSGFSVPEDVSTKADRIGSDKPKKCKLPKARKGKKKKAIARTSLSNRPRRACTLKRPITECKPPVPIKKTKMIPGTVESLVVNCDPSPLVSNVPNAKITTDAAVSASSSKVLPRVPLRAPLMGNTMYLRLMPNNQNPLSYDNITKTNSCKNSIPTSYRSLPQNQPVTGKVLLINSVPCLVQNGCEIQLPMIHTSGPLQAAANLTASVGNKINVKPSPPETIKIESDSDQEDNKNLIQDEIKKLKSPSSSSSAKPGVINSKSTVPQAPTPSARSLTKKVVLLKNPMVPGSHVILAPSTSTNGIKLTSVKLSKFRRQNQ